MWSRSASALRACRSVGSGATRRVRALHTSAAAAAAPWRVAVVGTGPSGFYTAKYLLKEDADVTVDLYDRMPVPYGA